jgi:phage gpG-like protein
MADNEIQGMTNLIRRIHQLKSDTRHTERAMAEAGAYMLGSIEQNFRAQGRPQKWQKLAASTLAARRGLRRAGRGRLRDKQGRYAKNKSGSAQILIDKARMKNSIGFKVIGGGVGVEVGLNAKQARRQQLGFPKGTGRGHAPTPARPFLLVQREDAEYIGEKIFRRHIARER